MATARLDRKAEEDQNIGKHVPVGEQNPSRGRQSAQQIAKSGRKGEKVDRQSNIVNQHVKQGEEGETSAKQREKHEKTRK